MSVTDNEPQSTTTIEWLNDDCLMHVFQFLTLEEKIEVELVCKNWDRVCESTWTNLKKFDESIFPFSMLEFDQREVDNKNKNTNLLLNILKRGGSNIEQMAISAHLSSLVNVELILANIPTYCCNITDLNIFDPANLCNDVNLKTIFLKNPNLKKIKLHSIEIKGDCLLYLDANIIEDINIKHCQFESKAFYYGFLASLKNLKVFKMTGDEMNSSLEALLMSKCDKITEIKINSKFCNRNQEKFAEETLMILLAKQTNLSIINLESAKIDIELLEKLPFQLQEVKFDRRYLDNAKNLNLTSFLSKRPNIRKLYLKNVSINERFTSFHTHEVAPEKILDAVSFTFSHIQSEEVAFDLSLFLSRHKIRKIDLYQVPINEKLMGNFPINLEELDAHLICPDNCEIWSKCFIPLESLLKFSGYFVKMSHNFLREFINCINPKIKKIKIDVLKCSSLSDDASSLNCFQRLHDLESFMLLNPAGDFDDFLKINVDYVLTDLAACKNLKSLAINNCNISEIGFRAVCNLTNLIKLEMGVSEVVGDELFIELLKKLLNLRELKIDEFDLVTNNLMKIASEIKFNRGDTHELKLEAYRCLNFVDTEDEPLVKLMEFD